MVNKLLPEKAHVSKVTKKLHRMGLESLSRLQGVFRGKDDLLSGGVDSNYSSFRAI